MRTIFLDETESTNDYLKNDLSLIGEQGIVVSTGFQTKGRGMDTNTWLSQRGENLLFSLGLNLSFLDACAQFSLSQAVSLGVVAALKKFVTSSQLTIKWPNDIYCDDKKLAGILISNTLSGQKIDKTIIGIGLNVNQIEFPQSLPNPISLSMIAQHRFDCQTILTEVVDSIIRTIDLLKTPQGLLSVDRQYVQQSFRFGVWSKFIVDNEVVERKIVGFNRWGHLRLIDSDDIVSEFEIKQIKFVL